MDLRYLQAFLGHANLNTVAVYTQVGIKALKDLHQVMHPAASVRPSSSVNVPAESERTTAETLLTALEIEAEEE